MPNWLDIVFANILISSVAEGLKRGFARTALGLAAVIVGLVCGLWFYRSVGALFGTHVGTTWANMFGFLIIFVGVILVGGLLGALIAKLLKMIYLSWRIAC
jgi:uncharacterized membrane protein required for colicin V production